MFEVRGALDISTVASVQKQWLDYQKTQDVIQIDLSQVDRCDTAGWQLLCSILKSSQQNKCAYARAFCVHASCRISAGTFFATSINIALASNA